MRTILMTTFALCGAVLAGCTNMQLDRAATEAAIAHYVKSQGLSDEEALQELAKAIEADPSMSVAYVSMGDIYRRQGSYEQAQRAYESACEKNPYYFRPHYNLGVTYQMLAEAAKTGDKMEQYLRSACSTYLRAITLEPNDYDSNLNLSACYFQLGKYDQAQEYCQAAIKIDPKRPEAYSNLGIIYDSQNQLYEAIKAYKDSLEINVHQPKLLLNLGSTYMRQGRLELAMRSFQQAAGEDAKSSAPYEQMGSCCYRMGNLDKAMEAYQKALQLNSKSPDAFRGVGVVYMTRYLSNPKDTGLRDKGLAAWNSSLELNAGQDDLKRLVEKYTPKVAGPQL